MIPYIVIALFALVGLMYAGPAGLVLGLVLGYAFSFLVGLVANVANAGLVPRKMKRDVAVNFIAAKPELVRGAFPGAHGSAQLKEVERAVEIIFRRAVADSPMRNLEAGWTRGALREAVSALVGEESVPERRSFLEHLGRQIEGDLYP